MRPNNRPSYWDGGGAVPVAAACKTVLFSAQRAIFRPIVVQSAKLFFEPSFDNSSQAAFYNGAYFMNANGAGTATATQQYDSARHEMVARQIRDRGIHTQAVLDA